ncbi:Yqey-like protein-domain-containing protein [Radiomyces spectabilis]|uniref:Yqey-like protein-domain-containing protein n=1 Tax=Radiomyces spectabilis TaxID=64574 RepID=UPI0022210C08|nr:Yqey-like protein-domain-containing protein [Radiomyces spectabilis]KAI8371674.1 Yqey-like protein-domain-containing protein [Radiomyces spectabilis]
MSLLSRCSLSLRTGVYATLRFYSANVEGSLLARLKEDRKTLMRSKKQPDLNVLKGVLSDYTYYIKSPNAVPGQSEDAAVLSVIQKSIKRRQDSVAQYEAGGRPELAEQEKNEMKVLQSYLPEQMSVEEIEKQVKALIEQVGATTLRDMGKVMKAWTVDAAKADKKAVSDAVKKLLQ